MDTLTFATSLELRRAVRDDLPGLVVHLFREARLLTQAELGALTGYSRSTISRIEGREGAVHEVATLRRLAQVLRIPGAMLGLAAQRWELDQPAAAGTENPVNRRHLLRGALAAGAAGPLTSITDVRADADRALAYTGTPDVTAVQIAAERHSGGYGTRAPLDVLHDLVAEMAKAAPLLTLHHPKSVRADLARAVGQIGAMAAIVLHDIGQHSEALQWFTTAAEAARKSGDRQLVGWVLARESMVPLNYGGPHLAARIAEQARRAAGKSDSAAAALAASVAARAYASSGRPDDALNALRAADRIAGKLAGPAIADTWLGYCPQKHEVHRSRALTQLGRTAAARKSQLAGIALSTPAGMTRTLMQLDAAECTRLDGDPIGACEEALDVFAHAPGHHQTGLVHQRGLELYRAIPDDARGTVQARRLADVLASQKR